METVWVFGAKPANNKAGSIANVEQDVSLCVQGYRKVPRTSYNIFNFAPAGEYSTFLALLGLAVDKKIVTRRFHIKNAFEYAPLKEDVYIVRPAGCNRKTPHLKLKKSLCGMKEAPMYWYRTLTSWLKGISYRQSISDPCLFIHQTSNAFIFLQVDDLVAVGNVDKFQELLLRRFPTASAHPLDKLLGTNIQVKDDRILLSQKNLIQKALVRMNLIDCQPVKTPLTPGIQLKNANEADREQFKKLKVNYVVNMGLLKYLSGKTRPDIAMAVSVLSRFYKSPGLSHWNQVIHCWKYLAGTKKLSLKIKPFGQTGPSSSDEIEFYTDATCDESGGECGISQIGFIGFWKDSPICWESGKHKNMTYTSIDAELSAFVVGTREGIRVRRLIAKLWKMKIGPAEVGSDNADVFQRVSHPQCYRHSKRLSVKANWLAKGILAEDFAFCLISPQEMKADILTKACQPSSLETHKKALF